MREQIAVQEKPVEAELSKPAWSLCPECHGRGEVPSDGLRKIMKGVKRLGHAICPRCKGLRILKADQLEPEEKNYPIKQCPECKNWYAVGAGRPKNQPCYHQHAPPRGKSKGSHCHWHDLSMFNPNQGAPSYAPPEPIQWEGTA